VAKQAEELGEMAELLELEPDEELEAEWVQELAQLGRSLGEL
jgi:hypothetical protein